VSSIPQQLPTFTPFQTTAADSEQWRQIVRQALADTRCASPAYLAEDLAATGEQTCTVQIAIQERVRTNAGAKWMDIPPITHVPIIVPRGGGYSLTLPLKKGDEGLLIFCDTCFDYWWKYGQAASATGTQKQLEVRRHHVHDCGFLPGMWNQTNLLSNYSAASMQLRSDDGSVVIDLSVANGVTITTGAKLTVVATGEIDLTGSAVKLMGKDFLLHEHTGVTTGSGTSGPVA
jgi:hypothetical protein